MRIVIDARMMGAGKTRGIGRYIQEVILGMLPQIQENETLVLLERDPENSPFSDTRIEHVKADISWYGWAEQLYMPGCIRSAKPDIFWTPHWNIPLLYRGEILVTIHDLLLLHDAHSAKASTRGRLIHWIKRLGYKLVLRSAIARAKKIVVPSQSVAQDVKNHFSLSQNRIVVTGEGVADLPVGEYSKQLPDAYLLYVGSAYPHKRLNLLLEAWEKIASGHQKLHLVIAGEEDIFMKHVKQLALSRQLPRIQFLGHVSDAELAYLYAHARAFVFPTSFEGFGLPPLEALNLGCPVIASNIPVLQEILPKTGVTFFQNGSADDMMHAISRVLQQGEAAQEAAKLGGAEARVKYDWNLVAKRTLTALRDALIQESHASKKTST